MMVTSTEMGLLEVPEKNLITMERPILGFEKLSQFVLVETEELAPFCWLQSTENPDTAFLVINPTILFPNYRIEINSAEVGELEVTDPSAVSVYCIVSLAESHGDLTANLQGPILINTENNKAKQLVLTNSEYELRRSVVDALEKRISEDEVTLEPALA